MQLWQRLGGALQLIFLCDNEALRLLAVVEGNWPSQSLSHTAPGPLPPLSPLTRCGHLQATCSGNATAVAPSLPISRNALGRHAAPGCCCDPAATPLSVAVDRLSFFELPRTPAWILLWALPRIILRSATTGSRCIVHLASGIWIGRMARRVSRRLAREKVESEMRVSAWHAGAGANLERAAPAFVRSVPACAGPEKP